MTEEPQWPIRVIWHEEGEVEVLDDAQDAMCNLEEFDSGNAAYRREATVFDALDRLVYLRVKIWAGLCEARLAT